MNADRLLAHYEQVADAPDAIPRLRRFVLDLAVRGKITDYLPKGNEDVSLGDVAEFVMGQAPPGNSYNEKGEGTVFVKVGEFGARFPRHRVWTNQPLKFARQGDILICVVGATIGKLNLGIDCSIGRSVAAIRPRNQTDQTFLFYSLMPFTLRLREEARGTAQGVISRSDLQKIAIWHPPVAEQLRIVAKVDELMTLCDQLEAARTAREAARDRLAASSLGRLNTPNPETFHSDARFAFDALAALTTRADQIKALRQTILNLAVRGKLVPQDANDEPASELLRQLKKARIALESNGKIRKERGEKPSHYGDEQRFDLPDSWSWARLNEIGQTQTGTSPSSANADLFGSFIPFIKPADLDGNQINYGGPGLSEIGIEHSRLAAENSILMVCIGATLGKVNTITRPVCFNQQINSLTPFLDGLTPFVAMALKASDFQSLAWSKAGTGTLPIISKGKWEIIYIPLPPLAEQHRIVARVGELMALCDKLEASLTGTADTRRRLLDALLAETLAPTEAQELIAAE
ncbi:hypothetical protein LPLAFNJD_LOCUS2886 [Methylorubrum aminovorans]